MSDRYTLHHGDCIDVLRTMPDASVDAIVTDPPYFRVLNEPWDRAWDSADAFTEWLRQIAQEWHRILRPDGTLYCFASPQMAAAVEMRSIAPAGFIVHNRIVWHKTINTTGRASRQALTKFHSADNERIIMASPLKTNEDAKSAERSYQNALHALSADVYKTIREYLAAERDSAGFTDKQIDKALGYNGMAGHWFGASQWTMPNAIHYEKLRKLFNENGKSEYLRREYEDLRREYEDLRRPFDVGEDDPKRPVGEVWRFAPAPSHASRHPCEKPSDLLRHIILTSTRGNAVVLDSFAGSGAIGVAAMQCGRKFIGVEKSDHWYEVAVRNLRTAANTPIEDGVFPREEFTDTEIAQLATPGTLFDEEASA